MKWYIKASIQKILSSIPYGVDLNFIFQQRYGGLKELDVEERVKQMRKIFEGIMNLRGKLTGLKITEIGTGAIPVVPFSLSLTGAKCHCFDVDRMLKREIVINTLIKMNDQLERLSALSNCPLEKIINIYEQALKETEVEDILESLDIQYFAPIDTRQLPLENNSQDIIVSRTVLQHIKPQILKDILKELFRVSRHGGISIHVVSLHDEYAEVDPGISRINFLKYPGWFWENFGNHSIKYINRGRYPFYLDNFKTAGFKVISFSKRIDERLLGIIPSMRIAKEFRHHSVEELATTGFTVILEKL